MFGKAIEEIRARKIKEKIGDYFNKIYFIIEFLISIILVYAIYQIVIFKNYENIWNLKYIMIGIPSFLIVLGIIYWNFKKNKEIVEKVFISFLIPMGMLYVFFISPSYVPDEHAHIWKALEVSEGKIITEIREDGTSPTEIPKFFNKYRIPKIKTYGEFNSASQKETNYDEKVEVENPAQAYPAILYSVSSLGFLLGRVLNLNGIIAIYIARIFNFAIFLLLGYYSIKIIPFGKRIIGILLFLPMSFQQGASISADSLLNSVSIFYISYIIYTSYKEEKISLKNKLAIACMSIIIGISKIVYLPLVMLTLMLSKNKQTRKREKALFIGITVLITAICGLGWYVFMQQYGATQSVIEYNNSNKIDFKGQLVNIKNNPIILMEVFNNVLRGGAYIGTLIGSHLGWLNIETSTTTINMFMILLFISPFLDINTNNLDKKEKGLNLIIFAGTYALIILAGYLSWTNVGDTNVAGIQGRYFIPILILPLLSLCSRDRYLKFKHINLILPAICIILNINVITDLIQFFI